MNLVHKKRGASGIPAAPGFLVSIYQEAVIEPNASMEVSKSVSKAT